MLYTVNVEHFDQVLNTTNPLYTIRYSSIISPWQLQMIPDTFLMNHIGKTSLTPFPRMADPLLHPLTVSFDAEAEGRLQFANVVLDADV